jgi:basic membrane protein A
VGGIDGSVSRQVWQGLQKADQELGVCAQFLESRAEGDYALNIIELAEQHFDLIVAASPALVDAVQEMARRYPGTQFVIVDGAADPSLPNVDGITFRVDEAAFPAGYLAAAWAALKDPASPMVSYVASRQNPLAEQYVTAFEAGVDYYQAQKDTGVQFRGAYLTDPSTQEALGQANSLIDLGADVLLAVGGGSSLSWLTAVKERGKWGIGSDEDQYLTQPKVGELLLTSVVKNLDTAVYLFVERLIEGESGSRDALVGTLQNGSVGLAPFHDVDAAIPDATKQELQQIQQAIENGRLSTGWKRP